MKGAQTNNGRTPLRPRDHDSHTAPCVSRNIVRPRAHNGHDVYGLRSGTPALDALGDRSQDITTSAERGASFRPTRLSPVGAIGPCGPLRHALNPRDFRGASAACCPCYPHDAYESIVPRGRAFNTRRAVLQSPRQFRRRACRAATVLLRGPPLRLAFPARTPVQKRHRPASVARPQGHPPALSRRRSL